MHLLITGGGRGIGRAVAKMGAARGYAISLSYARDADAAAYVVAEIEQAGGRAMAWQADAASAEDTERFFDAAVAAFGLPDVVVANAGQVLPAGKLADRDVAEMARMFAVNVNGAFLTAREAARRMSTERGGKGGALVIVSSAAARLGSGGEYVDYAASKGATDTLTIGLAKEISGEGVRVNAVRPGLIETEIHGDSGDPNRAQRLGGGTPIGRAGTAEEVAEAILWLASDAASYVTGAIVDVSGGR